MTNYRIKGFAIDGSTKIIIGLILFLEIFICTHLYLGFKKFNQYAAEKQNLSCIKNEKHGILVPGGLKMECFLAEIDDYHLEQE